MSGRIFIAGRGRASIGILIRRVEYYMTIRPWIKFKFGSKLNELERCASISSTDSTEEVYSEIEDLTAPIAGIKSPFFSIEEPKTPERRSAWSLTVPRRPRRPLAFLKSFLVSLPIILLGTYEFLLALHIGH